MRVPWNEDMRVKFPATIQFMRLGYDYQSLKDAEIHTETRIFLNRFVPAIQRINSGKDLTAEQTLAEVEEIHNIIKNNDMGKEFLGRLLDQTADIKLIDFAHPEANDFAIVDELTFGPEAKGSFRPDVTVLINGIPLGFLEVKKPNNEGGIQKEFHRMLDERLQVPEFKKYFNMLQFVTFSNNMEYETDNDAAPAEEVRAGSFYSTPNGNRTFFSFFREENPKTSGFKEISMDEVRYILKDNGYSPSYADTEEFQTNLQPTTPCNRFVTSFFDIPRMMYLLQYGFFYWNGDIPWLSVVDFGSVNKYVSTTEKHISEAGLNNSATKMLKADDIIISARGTVGAMAMLEKPMAFNQSCFGLRAKPEVVDQEFLFYYLRFYMKNITQKSQGSVFATINLDTFDMIDLNLPPLNVQKKIAKVLSDIDAKIDNNNAICADLEGMAKLLYDYWFVQFDFPDENGKPYKSSGGKMVWNEELKREIPEGWTVVSYRECIQSVNTGLNPRDNFKLNTGGNIRYLTVKNLTTSGNIDFASCDFIDDAARNIVHRRSDISIGDVLFASIAPLGRCFLIDEEPTDWDINESVFSIRPNYQRMTSKFLYMTFMGDSFIKKATNSSTGSVFKGIRINDLMEMKTILPPMSVLQHFDEKVEKLFATKSNCVAESVELTSMRDFLLPMLMNGQVKVKGA